MRSHRLVFFLIISLATIIAVLVWRITIIEINEFREGVNNVNDKEVKADLLKARKTLFNQIAQNKENISYLTSIVQEELRDNDSKDLPRHLLDFIKSYKEYYQVRIIDAQGNEVYRITNNKSSEADHADLQNKGDRYYFKETKNKRPGEYYLSYLDLNIENGALEIPYRPTYRICSPIYLGEYFYGIIVLNFEFNNFLVEMNHNGIIVLNEFSEYFQMENGENRFALRPSNEFTDTTKYFFNEVQVGKDRSWKISKKRIKDVYIVDEYKNKLVLFLIIITLGIAIVVGIFIYYQKSNIRHYNIIEGDLQIQKKLTNDLRRTNKILNEKDLLIQEIHHRVKNNLQIISSITSLESYKYKDERIRGSLINVQNRIYSMATVHELLYQENLDANLNIKMLVDKLIDNIVHNQVGDNAIKVRLNVEEVSLSLDAAIPIGLILNEVLTNSVKYAFPDQEGEIFVMLKKKSDEVILMVSDNGIGFDMGSIKKSLGSKMISALVKQLYGQFEIYSKPGEGTSYNIRFKEEIKEE